MDQIHKTEEEPEEESPILEVGVPEDKDDNPYKGSVGGDHHPLYMEFMAAKSKREGA